MPQDLVEKKDLLSTHRNQKEEKEKERLECWEEQNNGTLILPPQLPLEKLAMAVEMFAFTQTLGGHFLIFVGFIYLFPKILQYKDFLDIYWLRKKTNEE